MRTGKRVITSAIVAGALLWTVHTGATAQDNDVVAHAVSINEKGATVTFELVNGQEVSLTIGDGILKLNGAEVAEYQLAAGTEQVWRETLAQAGKLSTAELLEAINDWEGNEGAEVNRALSNAFSPLRVQVIRAEAALELARAQGDLAAAAAELDAEQIGRLDELVIDLSELGASERGLAFQMDDLREQLAQVNNLGLQVDDARIHMGDITVRRGQTINQDLVVLAGDVSIFGKVEGNVIALDGDVILHRNGVVTEDVVTVNGRLVRAGGEIGGRAQSGDVKLRLREAPKATNYRLVSPVSNGTSVLSLMGMLVALSCIGFGFSFFAPKQLDVVSDTVTESFGKSFFAGLFATPLVPAAFVTMVLGLAVTVIGILLIPFAIIGSILAVIAAATGGYLAVAKSVGSTYLNRRMAQGHAIDATPYKSLVYGLVGLMAIWLPAALLGWIPVMGPALALLAAIFTWVMVTAGFGAAILSRAGIRATFVNTRRASALTDEHYWPMETGSHSLPRRTYRRPE